MKLIDVDGFRAALRQVANEIIDGDQQSALREVDRVMLLLDADSPQANELKTTAGGQTYAVSAPDRRAVVGTRSLSFDQLSIINKFRCESHFHKLPQWKPWEWTNALSGEMGEAAAEMLQLSLAMIGSFTRASNTTKKMNRIWPSNMFVQNWNKPEDQRIEELVTRMCGEVSDGVIYGDLLVSSVDRNLGDEVRKKFNEKSEEIGSSITL